MEVAERHDAQQAPDRHGVAAHRGDAVDVGRLHAGIVHRGGHCLADQLVVGKGQVAPDLRVAHSRDGHLVLGVAHVSPDPRRSPRSKRASRHGAGRPSLIVPRMGSRARRRCACATSVRPVPRASPESAVVASAEPVRETEGMAAPDTQGHPPLPKPDEVSRFFWDGCAEHKLLIQRCNELRSLQPPAPDRVPQLPEHRVSNPPRYRAEVSSTLLPSRSSRTIPTTPPRSPTCWRSWSSSSRQHLKMVTNVVDIDPDDVRVGMPVEAMFKEVAPGVTLPLFRVTST